uniref:Uncharacterized protein n=1 Tax=Strongyloides papillosus TaxID=174720 RepID=A0A0N5C118_STREA
MSSWSNCTAKKGISDPFGMCSNCISLVTASPSTIGTTLKIITSTPASVVSSSSGVATGTFIPPLPPGVSEALSFLTGTFVPHLYKWMIGSEQGRKIICFLESIYPSLPTPLQQIFRKQNSTQIEEMV